MINLIASDDLCAFVTSMVTLFLPFIFFFITFLVHLTLNHVFTRAKIRIHAFWSCNSKKKGKKQKKKRKLPEPTREKMGKTNRSFYASWCFLFCFVSYKQFHWVKYCGITAALWATLMQQNNLILSVELQNRCLHLPDELLTVTMHANESNGWNTSTWRVQTKK